MNTKPKTLQIAGTSVLASLLLLCTNAYAQIVTGSDGTDGALDYSSLTNLGYSTNIVINMADHPNGIYQYTYVNIPANVTVSFIPDASNTAVSWLVQSNVVINGAVNVSGLTSTNAAGALGGPGGYKGGDGANGSSLATAGQGPGGGAAIGNGGEPGTYTYGNQFLIPLLGGSGGGGASFPSGGGGGGGAILIAASNFISVNGSIHSDGGITYFIPYSGGAAGGSGGAIRLVASQITGNGQISASGGPANGGRGGAGRIRFDTYDNEFSGNVNGQFTSGFQPIIIPTAGELPQLTVTSVGGVAVSPSPTGRLSTPDAVLSAQQNNPIPIVVNCANLPLNSLITVTVTPMSGSPVSGTGYNNTGTQASSTATISVNIPRGGGLIYATAAIGN